MVFEISHRLAQILQAVLQEFLSRRDFLGLEVPLRQFLACVVDLLFAIVLETLTPAQSGLRCLGTIRRRLDDHVEQFASLSPLARFLQRYRLMVLQKRNPSGASRIVFQFLLVLLASLRKHVRRFLGLVLTAQHGSETEQRERSDGSILQGRIVLEAAQLVNRAVGIAGLGDDLGALPHRRRE